MLPPCGKYCLGQLVLWAPANSPLDVERKGMEALLDVSVKKIALANPHRAPYGRAAVRALKHAGLYDRLSDRFVMGENVSQAAQFAQSGNAQAGLQKLALARAVSPAIPSTGKFWVVPADYHPPLEQGVVVVTSSHPRRKLEISLNS